VYDDSANPVRSGQTSAARAPARLRHLVADRFGPVTAGSEERGLLARRGTALRCSVIAGPKMRPGKLDNVTVNGSEDVPDWDAIDWRLHEGSVGSLPHSRTGRPVPQGTGPPWAGV
jgi:hypothetical protein